MSGGSLPGRRSRLFFAVLLVAIGVVAAGPAVGASDGTDVVRVVVQLDEPPLALYRDTLPGLTGVLQARTADGHLDVAATASQSYLAYLDARQDEFEQLLATAVPGAVVHWRYGIALNGLTVALRRDQVDAVRRLPGVVAATETYPLQPELDESRALLDLETLWGALPPSPLGAGTGRRVALIDSGVNPAHPFFDDAGYGAPPGYPKAQRVSGGQRTNLPTDVYASNKVIVGNVYTMPGDDSSTPWGPGSIHGTHVAGIMAGVPGTYSYSSGPATFDLPFSGMAPGAYVMAYTLAGDSAEFLAAIEDVVADRADALNISLGHSRWLTTNIRHDPLRAALDAAVEAGTVVAASAGNAGANGDSSVTGAWKLSPKVITVASSSHGRVFSNAVTVTGPGTPPASLQDRVGVPGAAPAPPIASTISGLYAVAPGGNGTDAGDGCAALPAGSLTGRIALIARGNCTFDVKKNNALGAGAIAMIVHNNGADAPIAMGGFTGPTIPAVMITRADGRAMVSWAQTNASPTVDIEGPVQRLRSGWPDVVSSFSSRGPSPTMTIKPDIAAPGASILSSVVDDAGNVRPPFFEQLSGTSMATPHVTGLAALVKALHPTWAPSQVKSALLNTADASMFLDVAETVPALAKHRGAGRVQPSRLASPQLTFDPPSVSFGLVPAGDTGQVTITATDTREAGSTAITYTVRARDLVGNPAVTVTGTPSFTTTPDSSAAFTVDLATLNAPPGDYEGFLEVSGGGQTYTLPYFVRVQDPAVVKDVLLIDWDRNVGADFRPVYTGALSAKGLSFDVFNGGTSTAANGNPGPTLAELQNYRAVVLFTGNNATNWSSTHVGGSFPLQDYLVGGGKLILTGQDLNSQIAFNQNTGTDFNFTTMAGWLDGFQKESSTCTTTRSDVDFYGPLFTGLERLETTFTLLGRTGDVSVNRGGDGRNNQRFPDAGRPVTGADSADPCVLVYNGVSIGEHARVLGRYVSTKANDSAVSRLTDAVATGVAPDPTLAEREPRVSWTAALLHVGAEGINANLGNLSSADALGLLHDFVTDAVSVAVTTKVRSGRVEFVAHAASSRGAPISEYRWDFGDGSPVVTTTSARVTHEYARGTYTVLVEAVDGLTRSGVGTTSVTIRKK
jgi:minor extracellular serine protease Vpr